MNRFIVMGLITLVLVVLIFTYNPSGKYLAVYKNRATIEFNIEDGYNLSSELTGDALYLEKEEIKSKSVSWILIPKSDGKTVIKYTYKKDNSDDSIYTVTYEFKVTDNIMYWIKGEAIGILDFPNPE